jgi:hypothetical protein
MNRYGKPRNYNYLVNVCDDVVLLSMHKDPVKKTHKKCVTKKSTNDIKKENLRTPIIPRTRT